MKVNILKLTDPNYPGLLRNSHPIPKELFWIGAPLKEILKKPRVGLVGSRKATAYGRGITEEIATKLARAGVVIISGLAFGVDSYAHKATVEAGGTTIAVLPSPLESIYPRSHHHLAEQILQKGGALVTEYPAGSDIYKENFIARNRIVSALCDVLVIPEAARNSGSLHTARFALEQGKTVMAVPGNIDSPLSEGCNNLIKSGAQPVTDVSDIFFALGIKPEKRPRSKIMSGTPEEQLVLDLISQGIQHQEELATVAQLSVPQISSTLTTLELHGHIRPAGAGNWLLS